MPRSPTSALLLFLVAAVALTIGTALAQDDEAFDLPWWSAEGGAGRAEGGEYSLAGGAGQADAAASMQGGGFSLTGGFWTGAGSGASGRSQTPLFIPYACSAAVCGSGGSTGFAYAR